MGLRLLITGSTGYVGSHLVSGALAGGAEVHALVRKTSHFEHLPSGTEIHQMNAKIEDLDKLVVLIRPDVIIHLASAGPGKEQVSTIHDLLEVDLGIGVRLLESAVGLKAGFIGIGSYWEFDSDGQDHPNGKYAAIKCAFRKILNSYVSWNMISAEYIVLHDVYGPGDWRSKFLTLIASQTIGCEVVNATPGLQVVDYVHIDDVVEGILSASSRIASGEGVKNDLLPVYSLRGGSPQSLRKVVERLMTVSGTPVEVNWGARPYPEGQILIPWLGPLPPKWLPKISLEDGLSQIVEKKIGRADFKAWCS